MQLANTVDNDSVLQQGVRKRTGKDCYTGKASFLLGITLETFYFFRGRKDYWSNNSDCRINTADI